MLDKTKEKDTIEFLKTTFDTFDEECIGFKDTLGLKTTEGNTATNALGGSSASSSSATATLGFNAYRASDGKYGVVTAAHFATSGTIIKNALGTSIGSASVRQYSGPIDAAFIPFPSTIIKSYRLCVVTVPDADRLTGWGSSTIVAGVTTYKYGKTTGLNSGQVVSASTSINVGGITFTDQIKISNTQLAGDSGAPVVVVPYGPMLYPEKNILGIATFADTSNNGYVSKVGNIKSALSITPYVY